MKRYIIPILILTALGACHGDDDPQPVAQDPFIGSWQYIDSYINLDIQVNFTAYKSIEGYKFRDVSIQYSEIPTTETLTYNVELSDPFAANEGFGRIRIIGSWTTTCLNGMECDKWIFVDFNYNKIMNAGSAMSVQNVNISMINKEEVLLENQEIARN